MERKEDEQEGLSNSTDTTDPTGQDQKDKNGVLWSLEAPSVHNEGGARTRRQHAGQEVKRKTKNNVD